MFGRPTPSISFQPKPSVAGDICKMRSFYCRSPINITRAETPFARATQNQLSQPLQRMTHDRPQGLLDNCCG
jgi:hypothetical protein